VHISEWDWVHVPELSRIAKEGDRVEVKLIEVDQRTGKFRLSRKALLTEGARAQQPSAPAGDQPPHAEHGGHGGPPRHDRPRRDGGHRREGHGR
jgi:polyribonucleotide nucleotidyltransferase